MNSNQKRPVIFYGWWIVGAGFLINLLVCGLVHFGFTAFFEPIVDEFGWSYAQVSLAASLRGMEMGILTPLTGLAVDRYGPRKLVFVGAIILAIGLVLVSRVNTLAMFYVAFIVVAMGMCACASLVPLTAVAGWFRRKASIALGITSGGVAAGGLLIPLITILIDELGWRMTILSLGLGICGLVLVLSLLLRHKPEHYGYLPDGETASFQNAYQAATIEEIPVTEMKIKARQILANRTFWRLALSYMGSFLAVMAVLTHIMPYLSNIGIARAASSLLASAVPVVTIFGRLGFGWLGDKFNKKWLTIITFISIGLGMLLCGSIAIGGIWLALPFTVLFSVGYGGNATMMAVLVGAYFPRSSFGTVLGFMMGISAIGQILGPTLAGWIFDISGSYLGAWFSFAFLVFISTMIIVTTPLAATGVKSTEKK